MVASLQSLLILGIMLVLAGAISAIYLIVHNKREIESLRNTLAKEKEDHQYQKQLMTKLIRIAEETQKRIAIELHDNLGASLNMAKSNVSLIPDHVKGPITEDLSNILHHTSSTLDEVVYHVRNISRDLQPDVLERQGLIGAVNDFIQGILLRRNVEIKLRYNTDISHLTPDTELAIYRIIQESVNNTVKYARATNINIEIQLNGDNFWLKISDNGIGFNIEQVEKRSSGIGLLNMKIRADQVNAILEVSSEIGEGTSITVYNHDQHNNSRRPQTLSAVDQ